MIHMMHKLQLCDVFIRTETVQMLHNYTYDDHDDVFERPPLIVQVRDLTMNCM